MNGTTSGQPLQLNLEEFAALIRKMREIFQWSQETLAELKVLNVQTVQRVEHGKSASFAILNLRAVVTQTPITIAPSRNHA